MRGRLRKKLLPCAKVRNRITSFETSFGVLRVGSGASRVRQMHQQENNSQNSQ
jgi:hypothetical protein